jgi:hypothetical protein
LESMDSFSLRPGDHANASRGTARHAAAGAR